MKGTKLAVNVVILAIIFIVVGGLGKLIHAIATTEWTEKQEIVTGKIIRMEHEEGEWERKKKTKTVKASDGTSKTETYYVTEWDEEEYEIDFKYRIKDKEVENTYYYEQEESSELYEYLKANKLMRGDEVELLIEKTYANGKYYSHNVKDIRVKGDKFRSMLWN